MADWKADKDRGPWPFVPQPNKWGYLNNPCWQVQSRPFVKGGPDDYDGRESEEPQVWSADRLNIIQTDPQPSHNLCGHWHKPPYPGYTDDGGGGGIVPEIYDDYIYVVHGAPTVAGADERDFCYKRLKDPYLSYITRYGGYGTGIDQLKCPYGVTVDDTFVYISDVNNGRVMVRKKNALDYEKHIAINYLRLHCIHTDGIQLWSGGAYGIDELNISTLATIRTSLTTPPPASLGYVADITCDADYMYVCDPNKYRIVALNKADMSYVMEFGTHKPYALSPSGIWVNPLGAIIFLTDWAANKIRKINRLTWEDMEVVGHLNYGDDQNYIRQPMGISGDDDKIYVSLPALGKIQIRNQLDLSYVGFIDTENYSTFDVEVVGDYVYSAEWDYVCKYHKSLHTLVETNTTLDKAMSCTSDGSYLYVLDVGANSIHKMELSDLSIVSSFVDVSHTNMQDPTYCSVDDTYIYVSDQQADLVHRISKATMTYVDSFGIGAPEYPIDSCFSNPQQSCVVGSMIYVTNQDTINTRAVVIVNLGVLPTLDVYETAPEDTLNADEILTAPVGITCDENYLYITNRGSIAGVGGGEVSELVLLQKSTLAFVERHPLNRVRAEHIACDDNYLYIAFWSVTDLQSYVMRYIKSTLVEDVAQSDYKQYVLSVDTWYPWYK